jgi:hypothetical protein
MNQFSVITNDGSDENVIRYRRQLDEFNALLCSVKILWTV